MYVVISIIANNDGLSLFTYCKPVPIRNQQKKKYLFSPSQNAVAWSIRHAPSLKYSKATYHHHHHHHHHHEV